MLFRTRASRAPALITAPALAPVLAVLICLGAALAPSAYSLEPQPPMQESRPADSPPPPDSEYIELEHRAPALMDPADLSLLHARQREIAAEAAFFGYDLASGSWNYDQAVCPALPGQLMLHYRRQYRDGAESLFTALLPRGPGRVFVVPVLYRNATPFRSASGNERSIAVFNRVVPADVAEKAVQPDGKWLVLALCYADMVGADAHALKRAGAEVGLSRAPGATLHLSEESNLRQIVFTDRDAPGQYLVWNITLNDKGRVAAANQVKLSDYVAQVRKGAEPTEKPMPQGKEPPVKPLPPQQEPTVKPIPQ